MQLFVSNQNQPHDVVEIAMWLILLAEGRKVEDGMKTGQIFFAENWGLTVD
jgi:hypothetical protein